MTAILPATALQASDGALFGVPTFGGIPIPAETWRVRGGGRYHMHEYPKVAGGQLEKLGRKPYTVSFHCNVFLELNALGRYGDDYYPSKWNALLEMLENEVTDTLVVPGRGPIRAYCCNWDSAFDGKVQSGEAVELEFLEDSFDKTTVSLGLLLRPTVGGAAIGSLGTAFQQAANENGVTIPQAIRLNPADVTRTPDTGDLIDQIFRVASSIQGIADQAELQVQVLTQKLDTLIAYCKLAERQPALLDIANEPAFTALMELWAAGAAMQRDLKATGIPLRQFVTPHLMTIDEVSIAIFGTSDGAMDLLRVNALFDPWAIDTNTVVNYYDSAAA